MKSFVIIFCLVMSFKVSAAQFAIVTSEKAVIYSDLEMTSPIGFVRRGKKIKVGESPKNKGLVYPIVVSGRIAYIPVIDVSTQKKDMYSNNLVAERFQRSSQNEYDTRYGISYFAYNAGLSSNAQGVDGDSLRFHSFSLKGEVHNQRKQAMEVLFNFLQGTSGNETLRTVELGLGGSLRFLDAKKLEGRVFVQAFGIPFSSYAVGDDFRVNGYGYTLGGGANFLFRVNEHWSVEAYGGLYHSHVGGFNVPNASEKMNITLLGPRLGLGMNYRL